MITEKHTNVVSLSEAVERKTRKIRDIAYITRKLDELKFELEAFNELKEIDNLIRHISSCSLYLETKFSLNDIPTPNSSL